MVTCPEEAVEEPQRRGVDVRLGEGHGGDPDGRCGGRHTPLRRALSAGAGLHVAERTFTSEVVEELLPLLLLDDERDVVALLPARQLEPRAHVQGHSPDGRHGQQQHAAGRQAAQQHFQQLA